MSVTITNLSVGDLPMTYIVGTPQRKKMVFLSGTANAVTDAVSLVPYIPNISSLDQISLIVPSQYTTYTFSTGGTVTATTVNTGTYFTTGGTVIPGTTGPFGMIGVITIQ